MSLKKFKSLDQFEQLPKYLFIFYITGITLIAIIDQQSH